MEKEQTIQMMSEANELIKTKLEEVIDILESLRKDISFKYMRYLTAKKLTEYLDLMHREELITSAQTVLEAVNRIKYIK